VERGHGVVAVVLAAEQGRQLELGHVSIEAVQRGGELALGLRVGGLVEELVEDLGLLDQLGQAVVPLEVVPDRRERPGQLLPAGRVAPDAGLRDLPLELLGLPAFPVDVKGTPSRWRACRRDS
jgi:hypothetical protein